MKTGLADIIIVNLNGKHYLEKSLASIGARTQSVPYQFVVVDNGSRDGSVEWLRDQYPAATLIQNHRNAGFSSACNQGIHSSDGEYILLLNNDTEFLNDVLDHQVKFMQATQNAGLVGPLITLPDGSIQASIQHFPPIWKFVLQQTGLPKLLFLESKTYFPFGPFRLSDYQVIRKVEWLSGACLMFSRSLFSTLGPLDENMPFGMEDMDYARRARDAGFANFFVPAARVMHHKGGSHLHRASGQDEAFRRQKDFVINAYRQGIKTYFRKHHSRVEYLLVSLSIMFGWPPRKFRNFVTNLIQQ